MKYKKTILTIIQVLVTVGALCWVFHDKEQNRQMLHSLKTSDKPWILVGILSFGVVEILAAWRWRILLKVQGVNLGFLRVLGLFMIGILFNSFMPGGTGGDVIKIFYLLKETPGKKAGALLAVLMDRLIGLLGLITFTAVILIFRYQWLSSSAITRPYMWTLFVIMGSGFSGIMFSFFITGFGLAHSLPKKTPMRDKLIDLSIAYSAYGRAWKASFSAFVLSLGVHFFSFYVFYAAARSMKQSIPILDFFGVMPVINTITALPISVGGLGVREKLFTDMLGSLCGTDPSTAKAISGMGYMMLVCWAIVGGVIYLFYRPSEHAKISEMEETVHNLEHKIAAEE